ncbi:MAG: Gfo/Idh/MocA family oxidoreductase [Pseudomonadota bacterium]
MSRKIRIGVIGSGYMGKAHAIAYKAAATVFGLDVEPVCEMLCTTTAEGAKRDAKLLGFNRSTDNWRGLIDDDQVDAINISTPPFTHLEMGLAAIEAGKPVFCEKPLAMNAADALTLAERAEAAGVPNLVGYNYIKHPSAQLATEIVHSGEIGEIIHFAGTHIEDYFHDPKQPAKWRVEQRTASLAGALADVGTHIINAMLKVAGPVERLVADTSIVHPQRPGKGDATLTVENDDQVQFMARLATGAMASIYASRVAAGKKMGYAFSVTGTKGAVSFDLEQPGEVHLYSAGDPNHREGFKRILTGPDHPDYLNFCQGPAHGFGYNDMIMIEARDFVTAIVEQKPVWPTFRDGYDVDRIVDAVLRSREEARWVDIAEI